MSITTTAKATGEKTESHVGCVIKTYSECVRVMSDIYEYHTYAVAYSTEKGAFEIHFLYSDYGGSSEDRRTATVDATETVKALYEQHLAVKAAEKALADATETMDRLAREALRLERGKTVKVVKGRKVPVGTVGEVTWIGSTSFNGSYPKTRVGFRMLDGTVLYTAASNVEVVIAA